MVKMDKTFKVAFIAILGALALEAACPVRGGMMNLTAGDTGRVEVDKDVAVDGIRVDIASPGRKVNGGQLHVVGNGRITIGSGGVADATREGRYCAFKCPIAFAADQTIDCSGREQMYFFGPLSDADPGRPAKLVKKGRQSLYVGGSSVNSPLSAPIRIVEGSICLQSTNALGTTGGISVENTGYLWYGGGVNGRAVKFAASSTAKPSIYAGTWGRASFQTAPVEFLNRKPSIKVGGLHDLTFSEKVSFVSGAEIAVDVAPDAFLRISGGRWCGDHGTLTLDGGGVLVFDADDVFEDSELRVRLKSGAISLNGTTQRIGAIDVSEGARVLGPGSLVTKGGTFSLPAGGMIGGEKPKPPCKIDLNAAVDVGDRLQLLWDDHVVDASQTTATRLMHTPRFAETAHVFNQPWDGDVCCYEVIVKDEGLLRLYYKAYANAMCDKYSPGVFKLEGKRFSSPCCYIESRDGGLTWTVPELGIVDMYGSKKNNVFLDESRDNFFVMKDPNPACPPEERYKGVSMWGEFNEDGTSDFTNGSPGLWCYVSPDGTHFKRSHMMTDKGAFDSINTAWWDASRREYHAFVRGYHPVRSERNNDLRVRDIRHMTSKDFRNWTTPKLLDFGEGAEDYPLYTNVIQPYYRDPTIYVGFPSRYVERKKWSDSYDKLCAPDKRKWRMHGGTHPRGGLTLWDTIFCFSRDTVHFERFDEAMFRPGPEHPDQNWAYGDTMVTVGLLETPARFGTDPEISMFSIEGSHLGVPTKLNRYVIRLDGFVSRHATYATQKLVTKPIVFKGGELTINFSTSARGRIFVTVRDESGRELRSAEVFGDKVDRVVGFGDGRLADFAGRPVTLTFEMSDADLYSFRFK